MTDSKSMLIGKAFSFHQQGRLDEARAFYEQALVLDGTDPEALHLLGVLELQSGNAPAATDLLERASTVDSANPQILANLGNAYFAQGRLTEALAAYERSLQNDANSAETWAGYGNTCTALGKTPQAVSAYHQALKLNGALADVWRTLADSLLSQEQPGEAMKALERSAAEFARQGHPDVLPVLLSRGNILVALGRFDEALQLFAQVVKGAPGFAPAYVSLGGVYRDLGQPDEARANYLQAIEIDPGSTEAWYALGLLYQDEGDLDGARSALERVLSQDSGHGKAHRVLASLTRYEPDTAHMEKMREILTSPELPDDQRKHVCFAMGKAYEDCSDYAAAFECIRQANRLHRDSIRYSIESDQALMERIRSVFGSAFIQAREQSGYDKPDRPIPVFIVGMPRSGTSLLEQIMASHPDVYGAGELDWLERSARSVLNSGQAHDADTDLLVLLETADSDAFSEIGKVYRTRIQALAPDSGWVVDKMPANFLHAGLIRLALPEARIIHCQRHPVATSWSIYKNFLGTRGHSYSFDQSELARYYLLYERLMAHWNSVIPDAIHAVCYEELVANQEAVTRRLLDVCGIGWNDACLSFHDTRRAVKTLSASQVRTPMYSDAVAQWEHYRSGLKPLIETLNG